MYSPAIIRRRKWSYYNEIDPFCVEWLRNLIAESLIAPGIVDFRPIQEVQPEDLIGFKQCHFFAGIGGWSYALRLAGVPDDYSVWTGSCPCQPFSVAGKRKGTSDHRHLWPTLGRLIGDCRPSMVFGEQVAAKAGREWLNGVRSDLASMGYAVGAADLCAASVGAPHIRQRLYWMAESEHSKRRPKLQEHGDSHGRDGLRGSCQLSGLANMQRQGLEERKEQPTWKEQPSFERSSNAGWSDFDITCCGDGKARRIESGTFPLAHGVSNRVGKLRGYGNAIVPQVAAEFITASLEAIQCIAP